MNLISLSPALRLLVCDVLGKRTGWQAGKVALFNYPTHCADIANAETPWFNIWQTSSLLILTVIFGLVDGETATLDELLMTHYIII